MQTTHPAVPESVFRDVLGHYCSGVTVITAMHGDAPVGFACQSFQSLSLDPPMVSFAPAKTSTTWPRIRRSGRFAANVLAEGQHDLCRRFAVSGGDKFGGIRWRAGRSGSPILEGALAWIDCEIAEEVDAGDHVIVLGRVVELASNGGSRPLLFYRGKFGALAHDE